MSRPQEPSLELQMVWDPWSTAMQSTMYPNTTALPADGYPTRAFLSRPQQNSDVYVFLSTETPPPGYLSEDGEASDQQMNQSMDTGTLA